MIKVAVQLSRGEFAMDLHFETDAHVVGVFGPSGAGKTTLMNLIAGLERPQAGAISINGAAILDIERGIDVPVHRRRVGVVFQEHRLFPHYTAKGNLLYGSRDGGNEFKRIVELLELGPVLERRVSRLSGGERQRVALGRALLSDPQLLLMDEPLASLDARLKQQIIPYLQRVRDESRIPMLYVSHDLGEILQLTDHLMVLDRGRLVGRGRYAELVHDDSVLSVIHDRGMRNVLTGRVVRHEPDAGLSTIEIGASSDVACQLTVPLCAAKIGNPVTLTIDPWDIALSQHEIQAISIQNQIRGRVVHVSLHERRAIVEVEIGQPLLVEISVRSVRSLDVRAGQSLVCLFKSHAIRVISQGD